MMGAGFGGETDKMDGRSEEPSLVEVRTRTYFVLA